MRKIITKERLLKEAKVKPSVSKAKVRNFMHVKEIKIFRDFLGLILGLFWEK